MGYGYCCDTLPETHSLLTMQTCALMRFSYPADSGSTVFRMKDNSSFQACDFTDAEQIDEAGTLPSGLKHVDFPIDHDNTNTHYYFASQNGCDEGQKVAILTTSSYVENFDSCFQMGFTDRANRVQNCDCKGQFYRLSGFQAACHAGYVGGCLSQMPDDTSCCNPDTVAKGYMNYKDGGNCIPKSKKQEFIQNARDTYHLCGAGNVGPTQTEVDQCAFFLTGHCPWRSSGGYYGAPYIYNTLTDSIDGNASAYEPLCEMWYEVSHCMDLEDGKELGADLTCAASSYVNAVTPFAGCNLTAALIELKEEITQDSCA